MGWYIKLCGQQLVESPTFYLSWNEIWCNCVAEKLQCWHSHSVVGWNVMRHWQHGRKTGVSLTPFSPWNKACYSLRGKAWHHSLYMPVGQGIRCDCLAEDTAVTLTPCCHWMKIQAENAVVSLTVYCHWMRTVWLKGTVNLTPCWSFIRCDEAAWQKICSATRCLLARWWMRVPHANKLHHSLASNHGIQINETL